MLATKISLFSYKNLHIKSQLNLETSKEKSIPLVIYIYIYIYNIGSKERINKTKKKKKKVKSTLFLTKLFYILDQKNEQKKKKC